MAIARKTVTVLFADVADSTGLGERLDPESLRRVLSSYFEASRRVLERHGGTVEKFIGDAVMAVFGVPQLHEDDAARAVRAAAELQEELAELNAELERECGVRLALRVGVNTGEVVAAGDPVEGHALVTGDAVNVAKRLEQAAAAGEVLVGGSTERLARASARFEPAGTIDARGKSAPVTAFRLLGTDRAAPAVERRLDTPFVGREPDLDHLRRAYRRAVSERVCHLFTLLGPAGIGKSRLACELFDDVAEEAVVVTGRCLPYGDGITFWPLTDMIRELGGEEGIRELVDGLDDGELIVQRLAVVSGHEAVGSQETFWAVRRLCEAVAGRRPLVLCFEDVHWAEPTFLDLIEYLAGWIRDAPILLLCLARPEFLDERPSWLAGQENAASLTLAPLSVAESEELLEALGAGGDEGARIASAAEGNPLYAEQMAAMLAEGGYAEGMFAMPPTIQALLAARLDRLTPGKRAVIERAAVAGKEFWRAAVADLTPPAERGSVGASLMSLVRKDLVRPDRSAALPDDAFRFGHVLIRDAAYAGIPKETRAELHERFAAWLEQTSGERAAELGEIVGYHLEQAYRYREQLGPLDDQARAIARRAGDLLGRAGRRAFTRDDVPAAVNLLDRAVSLATDQGPAAIELRRELSMALWSIGELARAEALLEGVIAAAAAAGERRLEWLSLLERSGRRNVTDPLETADDQLRVAEEAIRVFDELEDDLGRARAWRQISIAHQTRGRLGAAAEASEQALLYARRAGDSREESRSADRLCTCLYYGPAPAPEGIRVCKRLLDGAGSSALLEANVLASLAGLEAMQACFADAREHAARAESIYGELGQRLAEAGLRQIVAGIELLAGEPLAAERALRPAFELLADVGAGRYTAILLAETLYAQGRYDEAAVLAAEHAPALSVHDAAPQAVARGLQARLAARGGGPGALELADSAVELAERTDFLNLQGDAHASRAEVLRLLDRHEDAASELRLSIELYERKGNSAATQLAAALLPQAAPR